MNVRLGELAEGLSALIQLSKQILELQTAVIRNGGGHSEQS